MSPLLISLVQAAPLLDLPAKGDASDEAPGCEVHVPFRLEDVNEW